MASIARASGPKTTLWSLEPHTAAKHEILRHYLGGWFPVLSSWNGRVIFLDGFAGPGRYSNGEPGSPIIALRTLIDHTAFNRLKCEFLFLFCEADPQRASNLEREIEAYFASIGGQPAKVKYAVQSSAFEDAVGSLCDEIMEQKRRLAPTFAFVDPFGFSGLPMELLGRLLSFDKCELFVNYMHDSVNRFATAGNVDVHLESLFGTDAYLGVNGLSGVLRKRYLHDLYVRQVREVCGLPYVNSFEMITRGGHTGYYLVHGTRHKKGVELIKDAMWKVDPGGGACFSDRLAGQDILFTEDNLDTEPLRRALLTRFAAQTEGITHVEDYVLLETPYRKAHTKTKTLKPLEAGGAIVVSRPGRAGYPAGTMITFPPAG